MHSGFTIWFTGLSGTGKTTLSQLLGQRLRAMGARVEILDGDAIRKDLCRDLRFSKEDRDENVRRVGYVCEVLSRNGVIAIAALISPYRASRGRVRSRIEQFFEIHMECPLEILIRRDVKGLYTKALSGEISHFTGISDPYEPPLAPEFAIDSSQETSCESAKRILNRLKELALIS